MAIGYRTDTQVTTDDVPAPLLKWGAILGGLVLGLALLLLLSALWLALAYGSGIDMIRDDVGWFIGGSAIASLFVAGILTGYLSGVRGAGTGMLHGFTLWGVLIVIAITVGIPSLLNVFGLRQIADEAVTSGLIEAGDDATLWVTFWTLLGGFVAAGFGGMIGGLMSRASGQNVVASAPAVAPAPAAPTQVVVPDHDEDDEAADTTIVHR
jgi:hypothetical protein